MTSSAERIRPTYVTDTHPLIWYLKGEPRLSRHAKAIFDACVQEQTHIYISAIVVAEMFFAHQKYGLFDDFSQTYNDLKAQAGFIFVDFNAEMVLDFERDVSVTEMHDRIIVGLARRLNLPLITRDSNIRNSKLIEIAWAET